MKKALLLFHLFLLAACGDSREQDFKVAMMTGAGLTAAVSTEAATGFAEVRRIAQANANPTTDLYVTTEQFFDWAESTYPQYFPAKESTFEWEGYKFRYYRQTDIYLAVENQTRVISFGKPTGGSIVELGNFASFQPYVNSFIIAQSASLTDPIIENVEFKNLKFSQYATMRIVGKNLDKVFTINVTKCSGLELIEDGGATSKLVKCRISGTGAGVLTAVHEDRQVFSSMFTVPEPRVTMSTNLGEIVVELNPTAAPITVNNFLDYVNEKFFNGTVFHRIEKGFVAQGGWIDTSPKIKNPVRAPILLESRNGLSNTKGTIAMARAQEPNSATTQFFFNLTNNLALDYQAGVREGYAVFGRIVQGLSVMEMIGDVAVTTRYGLPNFPSVDVVISEMRQSQ